LRNEPYIHAPAKAAEGAEPAKPFPSDETNAAGDEMYRVMDPY